MNELFELFEEIKKETGILYFRQGSLSDDNFPNSFFTYDNYDTLNDSFYDNQENRYIEKVMVYFYTKEAKLIYSVMDDFIKRAKAKGFIVEGRAYDVASGRVDYFGRLVSLNIVHKL